MNGSKKGERKNEYRPQVSVAFISTEITEKEIKAKTKLFNSNMERAVRFFLDELLCPDSFKETVSREAEYIFKIPKGATSAKLRVETIGQPRAYDEVTVNIVPTKKKEVRVEKQMKIDIIGPSGPKKDFFISIITPEPEKMISLSSNIRLTIRFAEPELTEGDNETDNGTYFEFSSGPESHAYMRANFRGTKAICQFRYLATGEIHKRMLIK